MSVELGEARRLVEAAAGPDPEAGFAAVVALRGLVEVLEELQVDNARAQGWCWRDIARRLGVTKQAVHYKHALLGLLAEQASRASSLLRAHGLDLASARAELQRLSAAGLMPRSRADDAGALRAVGIDVEAVRER